MAVHGLSTLWPGVSKHPHIILARSQLGRVPILQHSSLHWCRQAVTLGFTAAQRASARGENGRHAGSQQALRGPEDRVPLSTPNSACEEHSGRAGSSGGAEFGTPHVNP